MKSIFAIIDTNILVSGIITHNPASSTCHIVDGMLRGSFSFLLSVELIKEYREVLLRPTIQRLHQLEETGIDNILEGITLNAILRDPVTTHHETAPDYNDQHLWNLLSCQKGSILITGDKLLLANPPASSRVISAQSFLALEQLVK